VNVSRARRRFLRWHRYQTRTVALAGRQRRRDCGWFRGYIMANHDLTYANRWAPKGIRDVRLIARTS
jgi:hypothetical protein